jgi:hypothetical protein
MNPISNPFAPGAGTPPPALTGRQPLLDMARIALGRTKARRPAKSFIAIGLRGVGKTVLLHEVRRQAVDLGFQLCAVEATDQKTLPEILLPHLRRVMLELDRLGRLSVEVKRALRVLKSFLNGMRLSVGDASLSLDIDAEAGSADSGNLDADLTEVLLALGRAAAARETPVALCIDELQYFKAAELGSLIMALHQCAQEGLPVVMAAAGLPQLVGLTGRSKSYAERMFDFPDIGPLSRAHADEAVVVPAREQNVSFTPAALDAIHAAAAGYPYFIQEWAYHSWNLSAGPVIDVDDVHAASQIVVARLDESFFRVRFDRLTPREKDYLRAMADLGPGVLQTGDIAAHLSIRPPAVAPLRSGLIAKGMIYSPNHGGTAFTVPLFDEFLRRIMPDWRSPYQKKD